MPRISCFLAAMVLVSPGAAWAFHPLITDDTGTQGMGGHQFEVGYDHASVKAGGVNDTTGEIPLTYTYGVTDAVDVFVGTAIITDPSDGIQDAAFGAKWRFYEDEASKLSIAVKPEVVTGESDTIWGISLIVSQETGFGEFHVNLAYERNTNEARKDLWRLSVAPVWALADGWKVALDLGLQTNPDDSQKAQMGFMELGAVYSPRETMDLSFGIVRNFSDGPVESTVATFGLTQRF